MALKHWLSLIASSLQLICLFLPLGQSYPERIYSAPSFTSEGWGSRNQYKAPKVPEVLAIHLPLENALQTQKKSPQKLFRRSSGDRQDGPSGPPEIELTDQRMQTAPRSQHVADVPSRRGGSFQARAHQSMQTRIDTAMAQTSPQVRDHTGTSAGTAARMPEAATSITGRRSRSDVGERVLLDPSRRSGHESFSERSTARQRACNQMMHCHYERTVI